MAAVVAAVLALVIGIGEALGSWVFDDERDHVLSSDMIASRKGYKLVRVGTSRGVLVAPDGVVAAVRWKEIEEEPIGVFPEDIPPVLKVAMEQAHRARQAQRAPCPEGATDTSCGEWCAAVAPDGVELRGRLQGGTCSAPSADADGLRCTCERTTESNSKVSWAMCRPRCLAQSVGRDAVASPQKSVPGPAPRPEKRLEPAPELAPQQYQIPAPEPVVKPYSGGKNGVRHLLYDTRFGVSFAAQTEILFAAMQIVSSLNKQVLRNCGVQTSAPQDTSCKPWTLVLPPWCSVLKWYHEDAAAGTPWGELFDLTALSQAVPVVEFSDFAGLSGGSATGTGRVDLAILPAKGVSSGQAKSGRGEFAGWEPELSACEAANQQIPDEGKVGKDSMVYSGYCKGDIVAPEVMCGILRQASTRAVVDMLSVGKSSWRSILLKNLDAVGLHSPLSSAAKSFHPALRPALPLQQSASFFVKKALGDNVPYLAAHLRRSEFARHHRATTPSVESAAARLNFLLNELKLDQVFIATDARPSFREALRTRVKAPLYYFAPDDGAEVPEHKGKEELIVLQVLAHARHFVGSTASAFSAAVQRERSHRGEPAHSSEEVFCSNLTASDPGRMCTT